MVKRLLVLVLVCLAAVSLGGCLVAESTYLKKVEEADGLSRDLRNLQKRYDDLLAENGQLKAQVELLSANVAGLTKERDRLTVVRDKLEADNRELEQVLKAKSDSLSQTITDQRGRIGGLEDKIATLEKQNDSLRGDIARLQKAKEEEVQKTSSTYEALLDKMKQEISRGQVTISELKGKLTVNMVDSVLFDSGKAEVKQDGLGVLQKVIDILKGLTDKAIRIEGHTDNVQIIGNLAKRFPTNWELSAARAINVARFLQQQGIDPRILGAVAYGEYHPVADNASEEGRAKNRRIEIILVPKE